MRIWSGWTAYSINYDVCSSISSGDLGLILKRLKRLPRTDMTWILHVSVFTMSPMAGMCPNCWNTYPPRVSTPKSSTSILNIFAMSSIGTAAFTIASPFCRFTISGLLFLVNSSSIYPSISSIKSSIVSSPSVPPNSSTTIAI